MPLHRRGTSKTYECLEDLLKEAGYKETRIFTPETERSDSGDGHGGARESHESRLTVRDGMEAVVGFFAGLLPGAMTSKTSLHIPSESRSDGPAQLTTSPQYYSPPLSPLADHTLRRQDIGGGYGLTDAPTPTTMTSSIESLGEPSPRLSRRHKSRINNFPSTVHPHAHPPPSHNASNPSSQPMQKQSSRSSLRHQAMQQHFSVVSPRPSRAGVHMSSASSVPPRPNSTPAHMSRPAIFVSDSDSSSTHTLRVKHDGDYSDQPPLPPSWLESVARAVLFGGTGAYIGGPSSFISHEPLTGPPSLKAPVLRSTRSSLSQVSSRRSKYHRQPINRRSGLSDQTNSLTTLTSDSRSTFLGPPLLFSQIERGRSGRSEGEVSKTRVVCRSAPGSRNGSVTRIGDIDDGKERWRERDRNSRNKREKDRLPSLARTQAEGDVWDQGRHETGIRGNNGGSNNNIHRYLSVWGADADSEAGSSANASSEEDDGELDLARILVPPKRQKSIKSLRKHLASEAGSGPGAHTSLKSYAARSGSTGRRAGREMNVPVSGSNGGNGHGGYVPRRVPSILQRQQTEEDWDGENQEWGGGWVRQGVRNRESEDDDVDSFVGIFREDRTNLVGTSKSRTGGNRLGFNGAWGLMGGNGL